MLSYCVMRHLHGDYAMNFLKLTCPLNNPLHCSGLFNGRDRIRTNPTGEVETKKSAKGGTECAPLQNKITLIDELLSVLETLSPESQRELLRAALEQKQRESNND